jgi:glutamate synthase domain-containing protein 2
LSTAARRDRTYSASSHGCGTSTTVLSSWAVRGEAVSTASGSFQKGSDVVKVVALGARAVMIGRAYLWVWPPTARQARTLGAANARSPRSR